MINTLGHDLFKGGQYFYVNSNNAPVNILMIVVDVVVVFPILLIT